MNRREFILASIASLQVGSCNDWWKNMQTSAPFQSGIDSSSVSENVLGYAIDFSNVDYIQLTNQDLNKPYIAALNAVGVGLTGAYSLQTLNLPQPGSGFGNIRSVAFQFRPYYSGQSDYQQNPGKVRYQYNPSVILYNNRTMQSVFIRASKLVMDSATVAGATTSYIPLMLNIQGNVPFFASLQDTIDVLCINPNSQNFGKLILNFFNFDCYPWFETNFDQMVTAG